MVKNNTRKLEIIVSSSSESEVEEEEVVVTEEPPAMWETARGIAGIGGRKRLLTKQLSMRETTREAKWEKRRRQMLDRRQMMGGESSPMNCGGERMSRLSSRVRSLTDEDWDELMGSIELGFVFNEEDGGHDLCDTLPALDLYFAVSRQLSDSKLRSSPSPASTPTATSSTSTVCGSLSPSSPLEPPQPSHSSPSESWTIILVQWNRRQSSACEDEAEALGTGRGLLREAPKLPNRYHPVFLRRGRGRRRKERQGRFV